METKNAPAMMSEPWKLLRFLLCTVSLCSGGATVSANARLSLSVQVPNTVIRFMAVPVEVTIRNEGDAPITLITFPTVSDLSVEIKRSGETDYQGPVRLGNPSKEIYRRPVNLGPGETSGFRTVLACRWSARDQKAVGAVFDEPGTYSLVFTYPAQQQKGEDIAEIVLVSSPVETRVREVGGADANALSRLRQLPQPYSILDPDALRGFGPTNQSQIKLELKKFVDEWPSSLWTPFAKFALAKLLQEESYQRGKTPDGALLNQAAAYASEIAGLTNFPYSSQVQGLQSHLEKVMSGRTSRLDSQQRQQISVSDDARTNIIQGLQRIATAMAGGNSEQFVQLLAGDFLLNDRMDRAQAARELAGNRSRLAALDVHPELLSAVLENNEYVVEARFHFTSGDRTNVQNVRLKGAFGNGTVQLRRWNRIASNVGK